ncbi:hypothetical protein ACLB2K_041822 [Fragaria x ananassa]
MVPPRRKKWTEAEERTLIDKYGEMVADGTLAKMKTREKKFKPIAYYVNSVHYVQDPVAYRWQWSWKDVSTKVQNMRHQYLLVKQKIKKQPPESNSGGGDSSGECGVEEFDWMEGLTRWANFLRYKEVFGDISSSNGNELMGGWENFNGDVRVREDGDGRFVCEEVEQNGSSLKKKRKREVSGGLGKKAWGFIGNQLGKLREMEARFEQRDAERERERQRSEGFRMECEQEREWKWEEWVKKKEEREKAREQLRKQRMQEWEAFEKESEERERRRREEALIHEREWEERINRRRLEWKKRMDDMLGHHRAEMGQMQSRILHEQQNLTSQLLGIVSQWTAHPAGLSDHTGASNHYLSQMMQNLHHVNSLDHDDARIDGDNQDDQFIVDG